MERNFDNKDFEQFLKQNADQYRMYPSEKVWSQIHNSLHPRRRWAALTASLLLITGAIVTFTMVFNNSSAEKNVSVQTTNSMPAVVHKSSAQVEVATLLKNIHQDKPIASNKIPSIIVENQIDQYAISSDAVNNFIAAQPNPTAASPFKETHPVITYANNGVDELFKMNIPGTVSANKAEKPVENSDIENNNIKTLFPSLLSEQSFNKPGTEPASQKIREKRKISVQLYFTPGVSYRRLTENKEVILAASGNSIPTNLALQDVKNVVTHKPDLGFELGLSAKYPLSNSIKVKAGFQFNVNKYDIRAFSYSGETATIAIQGDTYQQQTVTRTSYYRNSSGFRPNWLTNVYFSLSMPVGAEIKVFKTKKIDLGFGITAQPTYLLDNKAYLISTDFKNYVRVPDLIRRWNLNTGAELIVGIKSKRTQWQIGPQVRYQTLSSFKDKYPVKENLFNFGLKAGVTLNQ